MRTLAIIPARDGSKGIPNKNIKLFCGKPLIAWTIQAALGSMRFSEVIVSTDSPEIAEIANRFGANTPFIRPLDLSTDEAASIDVVIHAINMMRGFSHIVLLQPTSPLRSSEDIGRCLDYAENLAATSVVSVCEADVNPHLLYELSPHSALLPMMNEKKINRRQDLPVYYKINGAIYFASIDWLLSGRRFISEETKAFVMPRERSIDIDDPYDWELAEFLNKDQL